MFLSRYYTKPKGIFLGNPVALGKDLKRDSVYLANYFLMYFAVFVLTNIDLFNITRGITGSVLSTGFMCSPKIYARFFQILRFLWV